MPLGGGSFGARHLALVINRRVMGIIIPHPSRLVQKTCGVITSPLGSAKFAGYRKTGIRLFPRRCEPDNSGTSSSHHKKSQQKSTKHGKWLYMGNQQR